MIFTRPTLKLPQNPRVKWSSPLTRGLVGYWPLSDGGGLTARDIAGGNHGTLVGGVSQAVGPHGRAVDVRGDWGQFISAPLTRCAPAGNAARSFVATLQVRELRTYAVLAGYGTWAEPQMFLCSLYNSNWNLWCYGVTDLQTGVPADLLPHTHVIQHDGAIMSYWLDGRMIGSKSATLNTILQDGAFIGGIPGGSYPGWVKASNVSIHNRALLPSEIQLLYTRPLAMIDDSVELWSPSALVFAPPVITTQPQSAEVTEGEAAEFSVVASSTLALVYQWKKDGVEIGGATSDTLTIAAATLDDAGTYTVDVSNAGGTVTSDGATLTVNAAIAETDQPLHVPATMTLSKPRATMTMSKPRAVMRMTRT